MKPELTQKELAGFEADGKPIIAAYRRAYLIKSCQGKSGGGFLGFTSSQENARGFRIPHEADSMQSRRKLSTSGTSQKGGQHDP